MPRSRRSRSRRKRKSRSRVRGGAVVHHHHKPSKKKTSTGTYIAAAAGIGLAGLALMSGKSLVLAAQEKGLRQQLKTDQRISEEELKRIVQNNLQDENYLRNFLERLDDKDRTLDTPKKLMFHYMRTAR